MKPYSNISCFSTTRHGGCGEGAYATFNCTHYCGDRPESVKANLEILAASLPKRPQAFVIPRQTHTTNVRVIKDIPTQETLQDVDAVVTHLKDFCLCVSTADCVPVLLYDVSKDVIAAIHAGWRGTVGRIVEKTLEVMKTEYGTEGKDVIACIGPSISLESFEVGDEVYAAFAEAAGREARVAKDFTVTVAEGFRGSTYSRSALWLTPAETIELWQGSEGLTVTNGETEDVHQGIFYRERLKEADKYTVFLDGNHSIVRVKNPGKQGKLLVIRDSYSNCLGGFLAESYGEVVLVDLRYYRQAISELADQEQFDDILVCYSCANFLTDTNLMLLR